MSVASVNERLAALTAAGTSVWLDQIRRGMIEDGELARMVAEDSLRGVTSNPAIFEKAILGSSDYDEDMAAAAREGLSAREVYRRLAVKDVQLAADVLRPVYDETGGADGYVSLEVAPRLAHDTEGTLEQARMYWELVDRPNLMIKIPATDEGIPAIEEALYEGLNVNVTLLFAVSYYERVMEAFIRAMERRHDGRPPARPPLGRLVLRLARRHRGRQAARGGRAQRSRRPRRARQRPRRLSRLPRRVRRRALRVAARGRVPGAAAAVGLDRGQEPGLPRDDVRLRPRRPRHRQHDAPADPHRRRPRRRGERRDRGARPRGGPERAARRRHRPRRRDRQAAARRHRRVRGADEQAARRDRAQARGDRHRPAGHDRRRPAGRARAVGRRPPASRRGRRRRPPHLAPRRHAVGVHRVRPR